MNNKDQILKIRDAIATDNLPMALQLLRNLLDNSPFLDEAIHHSSRFQYIRRQIRLGTISQAEAILTQNQIRFGLLDILNEIEQEGATPLPTELAQNLLTDRNIWVQSLRQELVKQKVAVGNRPLAIIQHYGWLIEEFLRKMLTVEGHQRNLRELSFMTEAFQASLLYLCFIQVSQLLQTTNKPQHPAIVDLLQLRENKYLDFDYLNLLLLSTDLLQSNSSFVPEIAVFAQDLSDTESDLYKTTLFLDKHRRLLLSNTIQEDEHLQVLLDEYLTGLVFWLRKLAFLAKYRLISIKDIGLNYRLGTEKQFVHLYGELHGMYSEAIREGEDYNAYVIEGFFTYNKSILLLKGGNVASCLENISDVDAYISLSPLIIDQSVFEQKPTQTPEIFYYIGRGTGKQQYEFAYYKKELALNERDCHLRANEVLQVKAQNNQQPKLNELFEHLEQTFQPFKISNR
jgi:hypothetical protein